MGLASEEGWRKMMGKHLPGRYCISKAFVIDSSGTVSQEIDLVVHDRQYSPLLFEHHGALYVPAESVYAVFEIKQVLDARNLRYAIDKAASVRTLERTSVSFPHAPRERCQPIYRDNPSRIAANRQGITVIRSGIIAIRGLICRHPGHCC